MTLSYSNISLYIYWLVAVIGLVVTVLSSLRFFEQPVQESDKLVPSKYFANPWNYRLGAIFFTSCCSLIYLIITYYLQYFSEILTLLLPESIRILLRELDDSLRSVPILFFITVLYLSLFYVNLDAKWNFITMFRTFVYRFILIPDQVRILADQVFKHLSTPEGARRKIATSGLNVDYSDFGKDRRSQDRIWAELCYVYQWLELQIDEEAGLRFFSEMGWEKVQAGFDNILEYMRLTKLATFRDSGATFDFGFLRSTLRSLRHDLSVVLACYLVYKSPSRPALLVSARAFGIEVEPGPLRYFPELPPATVDTTSPPNSSTSRNALSGELTKAEKVKEREAGLREANQFLFVCHVTEDHDVAIKIVDQLEDQSVPCWIAPRDIQAGLSYDDEIANAIDRCLAVLLIFSDRCNGNEYIRREITFAGNAKKRIIPFQIENAMPKGGLSIRLSDLHFIDAFTDRQNAIEQLIKGTSQR